MSMYVNKERNDIGKTLKNIGKRLKSGGLPTRKDFAKLEINAGTMKDLTVIAKKYLKETDINAPSAEQQRICTFTIKTAPALVPSLIMPLTISLPCALIAMPRSTALKYR